MSDVVDRVIRVIKSIINKIIHKFDNYYTSEETKNFVNVKLGSYYTKSEVANKFAEKLAYYYKKTETYKKAEIIEKIAESLNNYYIKSEVDEKVIPVGTIIASISRTTPTGYLEMNGQNVSRTTYSALFAVVRETMGAGDGETTFGIADMTGRYLLGSDVTGKLKDAELPNIIGIVTNIRTGYKDHDAATTHHNVTNPDNLDNSCDGVFSSSEITTDTIENIGLDGGKDGQWYKKLKFSASDSNSTYKNNGKVQPSSLTVKFFIKY